MLTLNRRINAFAMRHPWRFAGIGFLFFVLLSFVVLLVFHRSFFSGLFGAGAAMLGWALAGSYRRRDQPMPTYQKVSMVAVALIGYFVLGSLLEVTGLLR